MGSSYTATEPDSKSWKQSNKLHTATNQQQQSTRVMFTRQRHLKIRLPRLLLAALAV